MAIQVKFSKELLGTLEKSGYLILRKKSGYHEVAGHRRKEQSDYRKGTQTLVRGTEEARTQFLKATNINGIYLPGRPAAR